MNCQRVQDHFIDYQDGTLPPDESAALRAHLAGCPVCQREWSALQEMTRKLDALPAVEEPSPRLREQFYAMLETHQQAADVTAGAGVDAGGVRKRAPAKRPSARTARAPANWSEGVAGRRAEKKRSRRLRAIAKGLTASASCWCVSSMA